jgi:hypothetical protein
VPINRGFRRQVHHCRHRPQVRAARNKSRGRRRLIMAQDVGRGRDRTHASGSAALSVALGLRRRTGVVMLRTQARQLADDVHDGRAGQAQHEHEGRGTSRHVHQSTIFRKRSALPITETELNVIAALAIIGLYKSSRNG